MGQGMNFWIVIQLMSLLIVGSCSRVTSNIVLALTRSGLYSSITISDPLPVYEHHQRYYRLRKLLNEQRSSIPVVLDKLLSVENLAKQIAAHRDVLHITHDYFTSVTSKNKIMELTARLASNKDKLLFAAPIEYDHYGESNPEQVFLTAKKRIADLAPNAGFLRGDVQDATQVYSYLHKSKKIWDEKLLETPDSFRPKVISSSFFTEQTLGLLDQGPKGADFVLRGQKEKSWKEVSPNKEIEDFQMDHQVGNIRLLVSGYRGPEDRFSTLVTEKL